MKKFIVSFFLATTFLFAPAQGFPAYLIKLVNGNTITTSAWWEEGGFVKFYIYDGVAGIRKNTIKSIEESGHDSVISSSSPQEKAVADSDGTKGEKKEETTAPERQDANDPTIQEVAILKIRTSTISGLASEELNNLYKDISSLRRRLFKERRDIIYQDQIKELSSLADIVEDAINSKKLNEPASK